MQGVEFLDTMTLPCFFDLIRKPSNEDAAMNLRIRNFNEKIKKPPPKKTANSAEKLLKEAKSKKKKKLPGERALDFVSVAIVSRRHSSPGILIPTKSNWLRDVVSLIQITDV